MDVPQTPPREAQYREQLRPGISGPARAPMRGRLGRLLRQVALPSVLVHIVLGPGGAGGGRGPVLAGAANWAQVLGNPRQNTVSPGRAGFSPRWGHAAVHLDASIGVEVIESMVVLGGDTVESLTQNREIVSHAIDGVHFDGSRGYRNDVHAASEYRWQVYRDRVEKTEFNKGMPHVEGMMEWETKNDGEVPPSDKTYDEWTQCDYDAWERVNRPSDYLTRRAALGGGAYNCDDLFSPPGSFKERSMWSPRRGHVAVVHLGTSILVMGGRAREHKRMEEERNVGGIKSRPMQNDRFYSAWREATVLKNDVWRSDDEGVSWELVNPGCRVQQEDLVLAGEPFVRTRVGGHPKMSQRVDHPNLAKETDDLPDVYWNPGESVNQHLVQDKPRFGAQKDKCEGTFDCWGDASCRELGRDKTCVCNMWSPREHFAAVSHTWVGAAHATIYVTGGFASVRLNNCGDYACGDIDAAGYRRYMNDVWKSTDGGVTWTLHAQHAPWEGRGGHTLIHFLGSLWLFNGQGGSHGHGRHNVSQHPGDGVVYFADQWRLAGDGAAWTKDLGGFTRTETGHRPHWPPRFGHTTVVEQPNAANQEITKLFLVGGRDGDSFLDDVWSWRGPSYDWVKDYSEATAQEFYLDKDSALERLFNVVPNNNKYTTQARGQGARATINDVIRRENFTTAADMRLLHQQGLFTVGDLAGADRRTLLRLRGFDLPQVPEEDRLRWSEEKGGRDGVCYMYALAKALVGKCHDVDETMSWVDGEAQLPRNARPRFSESATGAPPEGLGEVSEWHGVDWSNLGDGSYHIPTVEELVEGWDGCSPVGSGEEELWPAVNVNSIGPVPQVERWRYDLRQQLGELTCKQHPLPRAFHASVYFGQQVWVVGGKRNVDDHNNDVWYRDAIMPLSVLETTPEPASSETVFKFKTNKEGSFYRYRVYWADRLKELRPWSKAYVQEDVGWLKSYNDVGEPSNTHTELGKAQDEVGNAGPGHGNYIFYLRSVDPAGNEDLTYQEGRNMYTWRYAPDPPGALISIVFLSLFGFACYVGYEYHKYQRAMALERYAIKRIRRKFKGMMAEGGDRDAKSLHKKVRLGFS